MARVSIRPTRILEAGILVARLLHSVRSVAVDDDRVRLGMTCIVAGVIGWIGWNGSVAAMCALPLFVQTWAFSSSKRTAFCIAFVYYLVAARGLLPGAATFFTEPGQAPDWLLGLTIWLAPSALMAGVWGMCWTPRRRWIGASCACLLLAMPPIGIVGWANPITSAGALYPGWGWYGLILTLIALASAAVLTREGRILLGIAFVLSVAANFLFTPVSPSLAEGIDTRLGRGVSNGDDYGQIRRLQEIVLAASAQSPAGTLLVLPELVGGDWALNEAWWDQVHHQLVERGQTVLVGARRTAFGTSAYENGLFPVGYSAGSAYIDRVPVPIGMWRPWADFTAKAPWFAKGTMHVGNLNVGALICYEQLLVFPAIRTFWDRPAVLVGASNSWWAEGTSIPAIQQQSVAVWGRLFNVPITYAENR